MRRRAWLLALLLACSPELAGEPVTEPVRDWSFVAEAEDVAFETTSGRRFRSVALDAFPHEDGLYLQLATFLSYEDAALEEIQAGGALRMRAGGRLYQLEPTALTRAEEIEAILPTLLRDRMQIEARGVRWDPRPARYPGTQLRQWFFRLRSPGSGAEGPQGGETHGNPEIGD